MASHASNRAPSSKTIPAGTLFRRLYPPLGTAGGGAGTVFATGFTYFFRVFLSPVLPASESDELASSITPSRFIRAFFADRFSGTRFVGGTKMVVGDGTAAAAVIVPIGSDDSVFDDAFFLLFLPAGFPSVTSAGILLLADFFTMAATRALLRVVCDTITLDGERDVGGADSRNLGCERVSTLGWTLLMTDDDDGSPLEWLDDSKISVKGRKRSWEFRLTERPPMLLWGDPGELDGLKDKFDHASNASDVCE